MFIIKCKGCGKEFKANSEYRKFCNADCYDRYYRISKCKDVRIAPDRACPFTNGVECDNQECSKCGWNPKVADERLAKFHAEMEARYGQ